MDIADLAIRSLARIFSRYHSSWYRSRGERKIEGCSAKSGIMRVSAQLRECLAVGRITDEWQEATWDHAPIRLGPEQRALDQIFLLLHQHALLRNLTYAWGMADIVRTMRVVAKL